MQHDDVHLSQLEFAELSQKVRAITSKYSTWKQYNRETINFLSRLLLLLGGLCIFSIPGIWSKLIALPILSYAYYGIGITGTHETSHRSFVKSNVGNRILGYFFSDFWAAQSSVWWYQRHVADHHAFTNIPERDEQIFYYRWINKYIFFFVVPYFVLFWLITHSIIFLLKTKRYSQLALYLIVMIAGFVVHTAMFLPFVSLPYAIISMVVMRVLFAPIFLHLAIFNHAGLPELTVKPPWLPHQTKTTRNLRPHWFVTGMGGNAFVECHIEHHLFPALSNKMLGKIRPTVISFLENHGYVYLEMGYLSCLKLCLDRYKKLFSNTISEII